MANRNHTNLKSVEYKIVLGCPRSGTTFLMDCLNALPHSECVSGHLIPVLIPHLVNDFLPSETYEALSRSIQFSFKDYLESIHAARVPVVYKWLAGYITISELLESLQGKRTIDHLVYKEPFLSFAPEFIYNSLPKSKIIHIYRDGRDAADSLDRTYQVLTDEKLTNLLTAEMPLGRQYDHRYVPWWVEKGREEEFLSYTPYIRSVWMWKEMVRRCHAFFSRADVVSSNRVLLLKYEDLIHKPLEYGEIVVEHLGEKMNSKLQKRFNKARSSSIGIYKRRNPQEIETAERLAARELKMYNYLK